MSLKQERLEMTADQTSGMCGPISNWYNLQYSELADIAGTMRSADLTQVDNLQIEPLDNIEQCSDMHQNYVFVTKDVLFDNANLDEISNWKRNGGGNRHWPKAGVHQVDVYTERNPWW